MRRIFYLTLLLLALSLSAPSLRAQKTENRGATISRNLELFGDIYKQLDLFYVDTLDADTVIGWAIRAVLRQVDPFTDYYPEDDEELRQMATGKYAGIGSLIRFHAKENRTVISEPYEGTPAAVAGVKAGDVILRIDDKDVEGVPVSEVSSMLRGEAGTTFSLSVRRGEEERTFHLTRQTIQLPQVPYYGLLEGGVGYVLLTGFTEGACREVKSALLELQRQGAQQLIFDLRGNPGGAVGEAVDIASLFLPKGTKVVTTKGKVAQMGREYMTAWEPVDTLLPLVVLVDGASASSSEIVSGCLQDMDRAVVMGTRSYGKGLVQMVRDVPYHGSLKVTTSRYYLPSGRCIQAYDYRHPRSSADSLSASAGEQPLFHTAAGRPVMGGGGIQPDVVVQPDSLPTFVYDVASSDALFDWATLYARRHEHIAPAGTFVLTSEEYAQFAAYVAEQGFTHSWRTAEVLALLRRVAEGEGFLQRAESQFAALEAALNSDVEADLLRLQEAIRPYLQDEIVRRYYYQRGAVQQQNADDPLLRRALQLLADREKYASLLQRAVAK